MYNYKITLQYDGSRYKGWQRLGNSEATIQGKIEGVVSQLLGKKTEIVGCSRTDAGVHALAQIINFQTDQYLEELEIKNYMNHYLPKDISVTEVTAVEENFHARYHAKEKIYLYKIWNREYSNPFMRKFSMHVEKPLNIEWMRAASLHFLGKHDFTAFSNAKSKKKSMVREIYSIQMEEDAGFIKIRVRGDGFLYNMVRWIVGTLIDVGLGEISAEAVPQIIESKERNRTGNLAEACGLYLEEIVYQKNIK